MKKRKSVFKKFLMLLLVGFVGIGVFSFAYVFAVTKDVELDTKKINSSFAKNILMYDGYGLQVDGGFCNNNLCKFEDLSKHTVDAFVAVEDKRFFTHHGIDFIRVAGAIKNNLLHPNHKQGGSTITQQVVKNVQLDSSKTISRKLKEMKLAVQLEKKYSKEQIMELYLNSIYFGNGCYGIESASRFYFDKPASKLSIAESALLASIINAPRIYNPIENFEKANNRKNLVLKLMKDNNKIDENQYAQSINEPMIIEKNKTKYYNQYFDAVISEACKILKTSENQLASMNIEINTFFDKTIQDKMEEQLFGSYSNLSNVQIGSIAIDNKQNAIVAMASNQKQNLLNIFRQPGSSIKPILVYGPAFESKKYSPASFVEDKPINIDGYSPENANKKYLGVVNVRDSICKSINTVAVEILNNIGIGYAKNFAMGFGIPFDKKDNNLALALGGFTKGVNIKQLANAYACFSKGGYYCDCSFIKSIIIDNKPVFEKTDFERLACKQSTAYLINNCLRETTKTGTAKKLGEHHFDVCSKTGTVGDIFGNTDAYNIAYNTKHTFCTWFGAANRNTPMSTNINGASYPTLFNKSLLSCEPNGFSEKFSMPKTIKKVGLSKQALTQNKIEKDSSSDVFDFFDIDVYIPETKHTNFEIKMVVDNFENCKPIIKFDAKRQFLYKICRYDGTNLQFLQNFEFENKEICFEDKSAKAGHIYDYYVIANDDKLTYESNHIKLIAN